MKHVNRCCPRAALRFAHNRRPFADGLSRLFACVLIAAVTLAWFWVYDVIVHREPVSSPLSLRGHALAYRSERGSAPATLVPDMSSEAVRYANADVPAEVQRLEQQPEPEKTITAEVSHRKKKKKATVIVRRSPKGAMQAYAWNPRMQSNAWAAPHTYQEPYRGY